MSLTLYYLLTLIYILLFIFQYYLLLQIMFSRGSLVELLISSNIARYAEFQCVNRVLTYINDHIEQVS